MAVIRPADAADHDALFALWAEAGLQPMTEAEWESLLARPGSIVFLATDGDVPIGAAIGAFDGWRAYLYHVAVAPAWRRRGLAKRLMRTVEDWLAEAGARDVFITVRDRNTAGLALAAALGYEPSEELVMERALRPLAGGGQVVTALVGSTSRASASVEALLRAGFPADAVLLLTRDGASHPREDEEPISGGLRDVILRFAVGEGTMHALGWRPAIRTEEEVILVRTPHPADRRLAAAILREHGGRVVEPEPAGTRAAV